MVGAMGSKLVPHTDYRANDPRVALCNPAEREESRSRARIGEELKNYVGVRLNSALEAVPLLSINYAEERLDLKVVFDIHGKGVEARIACRGRTSAPPGNDRASDRRRDAVDTSDSTSTLTPRSKHNIGKAYGRVAKSFGNPAN